MGVQANWFLGDLDIAEGPDPLGPAQTRIEDVGRPIDLEGGVPAINQRVVDLLEQEAKLFDRGITCPVKDNQQAVCSACPIRHRDELDPMTALCGIGLEQERVITLSVIAREQPERLPH